MEHVVLPSRVLVKDENLETPLDPRHFWPSDQPLPESSWIISEANCPTISFDAGIVLLVCLVDWD